MVSKTLFDRDKKEQLNLEFCSFNNISEVTGDEYKPGVTVQNFSSQGQMWRIKGKTTGRVHQLMSKLEYMVFLLLDLNPNIVDIKAQYTHDLSKSLEISFQLGINHPPQIAKEKVPLTTDFIVETSDPSQPKVAVYVKYAEDLNKYRTIEKLQLERAVLAQSGIPLFVMTKKDIDSNVIRNIEWFLLTNTDKFDSDPSSQRALELHAFLSEQSTQKLTEALSILDELNDCEDGTYLAELKYLIQFGYLSFDLNKDVHFLLCDDIKLQQGDPS